MRCCALGLWWSVICVGVVNAAPTPAKDALPAGAIARLGTPRTPMAKEPAQTSDINTLTFVNNSLLFVGTNSGWWTWDLAKRQPRQAKPVGGPAFAVARDHERLLIGGVKKLHLVEPPESATLEPSMGYESSADRVKALAFAPSSRRVVFTYSERELAFASLVTGKIVGRIALESSPLATSLTANGRILAVATRDGSVRVYSLAENGEIQLRWGKRFVRHDRTTITFSNDGRLLAVGSSGRVVVLDSTTGQTVRAFDRAFGEGDVHTVAFSPNGQMVASGNAGPDSVVRIWNILGGQERAIYKGHQGNVDAIAFAPDGKTLASAGTDGSIVLWETPPSPAATNTPKVKDAWESLDSLEPRIAYQLMSALLADPSASVDLLRQGVLNAADEQARLLKLIGQLDHDEFRVREAARKQVLHAGLRAMPLLKDPQRRAMGAEGEQRVKSILEEFDNAGLRGTENGMFGEKLRHLRAIRVLELIGTPEAKAALEAVAKSKAGLHATDEARAALSTWPETRR